MELLLKHLKSLDNNTLARYWCSFNNWNFPYQLKKFEPKGWDTFPVDVMYQYLKPVSQYIQNTVPEKQLFREWNRFKMSDEDFELWWKNRKQTTQKEKEILKKLHKKMNIHLN